MGCLSTISSMKKQKRQDWIEKGYLLVAEEGLQSLHIESIARAIGKSKSSFYHYFGDKEVFEEELLNHHIKQITSLAERALQCQSIRPEFIEVLLECKNDLFFNKQLRLKRDNPAYKACFEAAQDIYEKATFNLWVEYFGLAENKTFLRLFLKFFAENFLLKISQDNYNYDWLDNYVQELQVMLKEIKTRP